MNTCCILTGLTLLMSSHVGLTTSLNYKVSSSDIKLEMKLPKYFRFSWEPIKANCSVLYDFAITSLSNDFKLTTVSLNSDEVCDISEGRCAEIDLNSNILVEVKSKCNGQIIHSLTRSLKLAPGDDRTAVRDFSCFWLYNKYINCTWQAGEKTPSNVRYEFRYWIVDTSESQGRFYKPEEFWDLIVNGTMCTQSFSKGPYVGCIFQIEKTISDDFSLLTVVTDNSKQIKPSMYRFSAQDIVMFEPPIITEAQRTENTIYVKWNAEPWMKSQLQLSPSSNIIERDESSYEFHNLLPDVTYTVKIRVKTIWSSNNIWSNWSKETHFEGNKKGLFITVSLAIIFSFVVIAVVFVLIYINRVKKIVCPKIPNPAKIFPKDFEQWIKSDVYNVHSRPEKEEVCPVYLLESSTCK